MAGYRPLYISGMQTGLVQEREEFILPNDAYPYLENAYVWRERIRRKQGYELLGQLQRIFTVQALGTASGGGTFSGNIFTIFSIPNTNGTPQIVVGTVVVSDGTNTLNDNGLGVLVGTPAGSGTINYTTGAITISGVIGGAPLTISFNYYPGIPVMGLRQRILNGINVNQLIAFDQTYAYIFGVFGFQEWLPGTTWNGTNSQFFWSTNYFVDASGLNIFWVTNDNYPTDPIRYTNGNAWVPFSPIINAAGNLLQQCLCMLPYRGRLVVANTVENGESYSQRLRWSAIGTPFTTSAAIAVNVNVNAWRDDIRGQGGFLDVPTSDPIVSIGFVRDNMIVYCENTTWQLRYTGRTIAPFQIERVNSELGVKATFSGVQFDTSIVGIGDKGVIECDSFKADRIDVKIPDLVFQFSDDNNGTSRVHGIRDFQQRLAYWTYPYYPGYESILLTNGADIFPNRRLLYNYENDSWAIFTDSLTTLGVFQESPSITWQSANFSWSEANFPWISVPPLFQQIIGGNQQGFVEILSGNLQPKVSNDPSLDITAITGNDTTPTVVTSPNYNMVTGQVIAISGIPSGTPFASTLNNPLAGTITNVTQANPAVVTSANHGLIDGNIVEIDAVVGMIELNGNMYTVTVVDTNNFSLNGINSTNFTAYTSGGTWESINAFSIQVIDQNTFYLWKYSIYTQAFTIPQLDPSANVYIGGGVISLRDGFSITSKKFNFLDQGQQIQMGYIDILSQNTADGAFSLNVYMNYNNNDAVNIEDENNNPSTNTPDTFFNSIIPTDFEGSSQTIEGDKNLYRAICPVRGQFLTVEYTLSDAQLVGIEQESDVQIDMQILWQRPAGRLI